MITGGLATIPARVKTLKLVIDSILPQLDLLYVTLNGHREIPDWLNKLDKVNIVLSDNSRGDAMKFAFCESQIAYYFGIDDDLIYPDGYVEKMIKGVDKYDGLVSLCGKIYSRPVEKFYKPRLSFHCLNPRGDDVVVDIVGGGVCAFHTSRLKVKLDDFPIPNMSDIWLSKLAWRQGVPLIVLSHLRGYLRLIPQKRQDTIWHTQARTGFVKQTEVLKTFLL